LISKKKGLLFKLIRNYINLILLNQRVLKAVELDLTFDCQLNCLHCYAKGISNRKKRKINLEEIKDIVDQCEKLGAIYFLLSGGESLLSKHIYETIKYINKKNLYCSLVTNGLALNSKVIKKLKFFGLDNIIISLDSPIKNKHNYRRGSRKSYDNIIKNLRLCKKEGLEVFTSTIITRDNLYNKEIGEIIELGKNLNIKSQFCFSVALGNWKNKDVLLRKHDWVYIKSFLKNYDVRTCEEGNYLKWGCAAGSERITITPYGDVMPCCYIQMSFVNIRKEKIKKIWKRMTKNKFFNDVNNKYCLPAYDKQFIEKVMTKINKSKEKPFKSE